MVRFWSIVFMKLSRISSCELLRINVWTILKKSNVSGATPNPNNIILDMISRCGLRGVCSMVHYGVMHWRVHIECVFWLPSRVGDCVLSTTVLENVCGLLWVCTKDSLESIKGILIIICLCTEEMIIIPTTLSHFFWYQNGFFYGLRAVLIFSRQPQ